MIQGDSYGHIKTSNNTHPIEPNSLFLVQGLAQ